VDYRILFTEDALIDLEVILELLHSPVRVYYRVKETPPLGEILDSWHAARVSPS